MENEQSDYSNGINTITIGSITLSSSVDSVEKLANILVNLLRDKEVKNYLYMFSKDKKLNGTAYIG